MTAPSHSVLIIGIQMIAMMFVVGLSLWLFVPIIFPNATMRLKRWIEEASFPPPRQGSYSEGFDGPLDGLTGDTDPWHQPPETEGELDAGEFRRGLERQGGSPQKTGHL